MRGQRDQVGRLARSVPVWVTVSVLCVVMVKACLSRDPPVRQ